MHHSTPPPHLGTFIFHLIKWCSVAEWTEGEFWMLCVRECQSFHLHPIKQFHCAFPKTSWKNWFGKRCSIVRNMWGTLYSTVLSGRSRRRYYWLVADAAIKLYLETAEVSFKDKRMFARNQRWHLGVHWPDAVNHWIGKYVGRNWHKNWSQFVNKCVLCHSVSCCGLCRMVTSCSYSDMELLKQK